MTQVVDSTQIKGIVSALSDKFPDRIIRGETAMIALYFSAAWCPPCQRLTPLLSSFYTDLNNTLSREYGYCETKGDDFSRNSSFEMVYVSRDKTQQEYDTYRSKMPWSAISFSDVDLRAALLKTFQVTGIPKVVLIDAVTFKVINKDLAEHVRHTTNTVAFARLIADVKAQ